MADEDGTRANTWISDQRGRVVGVLDADAQRLSTSYDPYGLPVMVTDRDGGRTITQYNDRGLMTLRAYPSGARCSMTYDSFDRVTQVSVSADEQTAITRYDYADAGRNPSSMVDPEGGITQFTWDGTLLTSVTDPTGVVIAFTYDRFGDLVATTNAAGESARLERDALGRVTAAVTPLGARTTFTYSPEGALASREDADGGVWRYEHSPAGRLLAQIDPLGNRTVIERGDHGDETATVDPLGRVVRHTLDDLGNLADVTLPDGSRWEFTHDALSRLVQTTDPVGGTWTTDYDVMGTPVAQTDPTGRVQRGEVLQDGFELGSGEAVTSVRTDELGRIVAVTDPSGGVGITEYDLCGRPLAFTDPSEATTVLERDEAGRVVMLIRPSGSTTRYTYDECGRLARLTDALGAVTELRYDADGRVVAEVDPTGVTSSWSFDAMGRVVRAERPGSGVTEWTYDKAGRVTSVRDRLWGLRRFRYNAAGELVEAIAATGAVTRFAYDQAGRVITITDPLGNVTSRSYNERGQVVSETDPLGRTTTATYDGAGRQVTQTNAAGECLGWRHDAAGRLASLEVDGTAVVEYERDVAGRPVTVVDRTEPFRTVTHRLSFDASGRLTSRSRNDHLTVWGYDADGRLDELVRPNGDRTSYRRDAVGRAVRIDCSGLPPVELTRDAAGRVLSSTSDGLAQSWVYDAGVVVGHEVHRGGDASSTSIERDASGRISTVVTNGEATRFAYDEAGQLVAEDAGNVQRRYAFDEAGRLIRDTDASGEQEFAYDAAGQLVAVRKGHEVRRFTYDAAGRRVTTEAADGRMDFSWGPLGWLTGVTGPAGSTSVHVDALGDLARVDDVELFWDGSRLGGIAQVGDKSIARTPGFVGVSGSWTAGGWRGARSTGSDAWSADPMVALSSAVSLGTSGEVLVDGLEWMGARVYDPASRGFLSADPLDPVWGAAWSGSAYSFAGNDPVQALDPLGLRPVTDAELLAYAGGHQGAFAAAADWTANNWEYLAGGAMVVAGGVLMATGVGGPAGVMLISAGADTIIQKATTGSVNWGEVALSGALGGFTGGAAITKLGLTGARAAVAQGVITGGTSGFVMGNYHYASAPGPHTVDGYVATVGGETLAGVGMGGATGVVGHQVSQRIMGALTNNPTADTVVLGRIMRYRVEPYAAANDFATYTALPDSWYSRTRSLLGSDSRNDALHAWVDGSWTRYQMMEGKTLVDIGAPDPALRPAGVPPLEPSPFYDAEMDEIAKWNGGAGYSVIQDPQPSWSL